ncbi:hypothetical protein J6590_007017 [Homalodisca vitripennis]|nr:hypothetical protein J6590_007017 [Homalodisca vitripennis]
MTRLNEALSARLSCDRVEVMLYGSEYGLTGGGGADIKSRGINLHSIKSPPQRSRKNDNKKQKGGIKKQRDKKCNRREVVGG